MKKFTIGFFTLLLLTNICLSQFGWYWSHPSPVGSHLEDVFFVNENTGYAVGRNGTIVKSTNAGINWTQLNSGTNLILYSVYFTCNDTGFVVSGDDSYTTNGYLLRTTNAGLSWSILNSINNRSFFSVFFLNSVTGFIAGSQFGLVKGYLYKTTDCGQNWTQILYDNINSFYDVRFLNDTIGFTTARSGKIFKTTNGGVNWQNIVVGSTNNSLQSIYFVNIITGYVAGTQGAIFKTSNGGENWVLQNTGTSMDLWDIKFTNENTGFTVGGLKLQSLGGKFLRTTNGGLNWDSLNYGSNQTLIGIAKLNDTCLISVGNWGMIIKTTNRGNNFLQLSTRLNTNHIESVCFINNQTGFTAGYNTSIMKTTNQGNTWNYYSFGNNYELNSINFVNINTGYVAGGYVQSYPPYYSALYMKIYKTSNSGQNWNLIYGNNYESGIASKILFFDPSTGLVAYRGNLLQGGIIKTTNGGNNWVSKYHSNDVYDMYFLNIATGYGCGANGVVLKSTNSGENWTLLNSSTTYGLNSIYFPSSNVGYAVGYNTILKTTDGGNNWTFQFSDVPYDCLFKSIYMSNNNYGYIVAHSDGSIPSGTHEGGEIITTSNGGINWIHLTSLNSLATNINAAFNCITFVDTATAIVVGNSGAILKTTNALHPIGIYETNNKIPSSSSLSQNYPNPFNPISKIKYQIAKLSNVKLVIFDILGREIETLVNQTQKPGSYEVQWDGSRYASGVYFYKLMTDEYVETKKMVLIK